MANILLELGSIRRNGHGRSFLGAFDPTAGLNKMTELVRLVEDPLSHGDIATRGEFTSQELKVLDEMSKVSKQATQKLMLKGSPRLGGRFREDLVSLEPELAQLAGLCRYLGLSKKGKKILKTAAIVGGVALAAVGAVVAGPAIIGAVGPLVGTLAKSGGSIVGGLFGKGKKQEAVQVVATTAAMGEAYPEQAEQSQGLLGAMEQAVPGIVGLAQPYVPSIVSSIMDKGKDQFAAETLRGYGNMAAVNNVMAGAGIPGGINSKMGADAASFINDVAATGNPAVQDALRLGQQDLKTMATIDGNADVVEDAMRRGGEKPFPVLEVVGIGGGVLAIGILIAVLARSPS